VLRRNRNGASTALEAAVMGHVHAHGFPVPEVFDADGPDLVMERVDGPTMLDAYARTPWKLNRFASTLADLHALLAAVAIPDQALPNFCGSPDVLVHGDLHPNNVILSGNGPVVIDWPNARLEPSGVEVANTWLIVASSEIDAGGVAKATMSVGRSLFVRSFLNRCDRDSARNHLFAAAQHRLNDPNVRPSEADAIHRIIAAEGVD
jgi:aminoglycoside phosphotransferase (APT) family kinase protein